MAELVSLEMWFPTASRLLDHTASKCRAHTLGASTCSREPCNDTARDETLQRQRSDAEGKLSGVDHRAAGVDHFVDPGHDAIRHRE